MSGYAPHKRRTAILTLVCVLMLIAVAAVPVAASPQAAPGPSAWYTVRFGDTLSGIAWRFGTSVGALMAANGIANPNYIRVGQRLAIPGGGPGGTSTSPGPRLS